MAVLSAAPMPERRGLYLAGLVEASTLLVLVLVAVPLKHAAGLPLATQIMGPVHGAAVLAFAYLLVEALAAGEIGRRAAFLLMFAALVPFGGYFGARILHRRQGFEPSPPGQAGVGQSEASVMKTIMAAIREFA